MTQEYYDREECRLCDSKNIEIALKLNKSPLCDAYLKEKKEQKKYDLDLYYCHNCGFIQIKTTIDPEVIYRDYIYVTTSSVGLSDHFKLYVNEVLSQIPVTKNDLVIDIGSNNGVLLSYFQKKGYRILGVEPSSKASDMANNNNIPTINDFFDKSLAVKIKAKHGLAKLVTMNNLYANIDNLFEFTKSVKSLLDRNGVIVIESSYLLDMIDNMVFDFIYHEHLSYFSILPLVTFFQKLDMRLVRIQKVNTKGGSLRYFWAKNDSDIQADNSVQIAIQKEKEFNVSLNTFQKYEIRINKAKENLLSFLNEHKDRKIIGFGASATSTTLITHFEIDKYIDYLVDENKDKVDTLSPYYHIPVFDLDTLLQEKQKSIIIILAWRYKDNIIPKINHLQNDIIIPLPEFKIIK